jgi:L-amino acid N-acyltransferase YncA
MTTSIRPATVADAPAIARVHVESSEDAYAPLAKDWPAPDREAKARWWAQLLAGAGDDRVDLVAERSGELVGFISGGPRRDNDVLADLEIYVIHVLPQHRGTGVGSQLWREACDQLRGAELRSMIVDTFAELRCCSFYRAHGGVEARRVAEPFHGATVTGLVYRWERGASHERA